MKKYYNIWLSKAYDIEKIKTNKTIKKKIFKFKINEKEKEKREENDNDVEMEREIKLKNIIVKYKDILRYYLKLWKKISMTKEIEIKIKDNSKLYKSDENGHKNRKLKLITKVSKTNKLKKNRKMKLTKLIESNHIKDILRKYFKVWAS